MAVIFQDCVVVWFLMGPVIACYVRHWRGLGQCTRGTGFARPLGAFPSREAREVEDAKRLRGVS